MDLKGTVFPDTITILPAFNDVLLPGGIIKISINYKIKEALRLQDPKLIGIIPSDVSEKKAFRQGDIGTVGLLLSLTTTNYANLPSNIVVFGQKRFIVKNILSTEPLHTAEISIHEDKIDFIDEDSLAIINKFKKVAFPVLTRVPILSSWYSSFLKNAVEKLPATVLFDILFSLSPAAFDEKLIVLKTLNASDRVAKGVPILMDCYTGPSRSDYSKNLMKYLPGNGITAIRVIKGGGNVMGIRDENEDKDITELSKKIQDAKLPEHALKMITNDMNRLKRLSHHSPDYSVLRNYLEFVADLPWSVSTQDSLDINKARMELEEEHYGMSKLKKRVLEYLAVCQLRSEMKGPILCFVGPPGVGKTSIGRAIARVLNKNFHRISLGGVSHQSEIRGHRRTYIGALPGRILQALKMAGTNNPVILLDEIDKVGRNMMGSAQDALLEVLDPEQNSHFTDHYLGIAFDLSKVTFITTANSTKGIPLPVLDRMEVIPVSGYTELEKFNIASRHLLPKQLDVHGLNPGQLQLTDDAIYSIIREYTRESGVRSLERKLADICRAAALRIAESAHDASLIAVDKDNLEDILGVGTYSYDENYDLRKAGVALGLTWSTVGGNVTLVEASRTTSAGSGSLTLTGSLGDVMKESAQIALTWVRSVQNQYGLVLEEGCDLLADTDLHIHFPSGGVSKEGPSAGITIACAILSLFTGVPLAPRLAMTGELSLQGRVLPVGGLREKLAAASRMGIKKVIVPFKCKKNLSEISDSILAGLEIVLVENMTDVVDAAFDGLLTARGNSESLLCSKL